MQTTGTATLIDPVSGSTGTEQYAYDAKSADTSAYTENSDTSVSPSVLASTYNDGRGSSASWTDGGKEDLLAPPAKGADEINDTFGGTANFKETYAVIGSSDSGTFTVETQDGGNAARSAGAAGTDTFHAAVKLAGLDGSAIGTEQFSNATSADVTDSQDRVMLTNDTSTTLQSLSITTAGDSHAPFATTGTVTAAADGTAVGGNDVFGTKREDEAQYRITAGSTPTGVNWSLSSWHGTAYSQDDKASETYRDPNDMLGLGALLSGGGLGALGGTALQVFSGGLTGAVGGSGTGAGTDTFVGHQDNHQTVTSGEGLFGTPVTLSSLIAGSPGGSVNFQWALLGVSADTEGSANTSAATTGNGTLTGAGVSGQDSAGSTYTLTAASDDTNSSQQAWTPTAGGTLHTYGQAHNAYTRQQQGQDQTSDPCTVALGVQVGTNLAPNGTSAGSGATPGSSSGETEATTGTFNDTTGGTELLTLTRDFAAGQTAGQTSEVFGDFGSLAGAAWTLTNFNLSANRTGTFTDAGGGSAAITKTGSPDTLTGSYTTGDNGGLTITYLATGDASGLSVTVDRAVNDTYNDGNLDGAIFNDAVNPNAPGQSGAPGNLPANASSPGSSTPAGSTLQDQVAGTASATEQFGGNEQDVFHEAYTFAKNTLTPTVLTDSYHDGGNYNIGDNGTATDTQTGGSGGPDVAQETYGDTLTGTADTWLDASGLPNNMLVRLRQAIGSNFTTTLGGTDRFNDVTTATPAVDTTPGSWVAAAGSRVSDRWTGTDLFSNFAQGQQTLGYRQTMTLINNVAKVTGFSEDIGWGDQFNNRDGGTATDTETGGNNVQPATITEGYTNGSLGQESVQLHYEGTPDKYTVSDSEGRSGTNTDGANGTDQLDQTFKLQANGSTAGAPGTPGATATPGSAGTPSSAAGSSSSETGTAELTGLDNFKQQDTNQFTTGLQTLWTVSGNTPTLTKLLYNETDKVGYDSGADGKLGDASADVSADASGATTSQDKLAENYKTHNWGNDTKIIVAQGSGADYQVSYDDTVGNNFDNSDGGSDKFTGRTNNPATANSPGSSGANSWQPAQAGATQDDWSGSDGFNQTDKGNNSVGFHEDVRVVNETPTVTGFREEDGWSDDFNTSDSGSADDAQTGGNNTKPGDVHESYGDKSAGKSGGTVKYRGTPDNYTVELSQKQRAQNQDSADGGDHFDESFKELLTPTSAASAVPSAAPATGGGTANAEVVGQDHFNNKVEDTNTTELRVSATVGSAGATVTGFAFDSSDIGGSTNNSGGQFGVNEADAGSGAVPSGTVNEQDGLTAGATGNFDHHLHLEGTPASYSSTLDINDGDKYGQTLKFADKADLSVALSALSGGTSVPVTPSAAGLPAAPSASGTSASGPTETDGSSAQEQDTEDGYDSVVVHDVEQVTGGTSTIVSLNADIKVHQHDGIFNKTSDGVADHRGAGATATPDGLAPVADGSDVTGSANDFAYVNDGTTQDEHVVISGSGSNLSATVDEIDDEGVDQNNFVRDAGLPLSGSGSSSGPTVLDGQSNDGQQGQANVNVHDVFGYNGTDWSLVSQRVSVGEHDQEQAGESGDESAGSSSGSSNNLIPSSTPSAPAASAPFSDSANDFGGVSVVLTGDANASTASVDENRTIAASDSPAQLTSTPVDVTSSSVTYTLHRDIAYDAAGNGSLQDAHLTVIGWSNDSVSGKESFRIDVTGGPINGFITQVSESGTTAFANLTVTITAADDWFEQFIGQTQATATALVSSTAAGGSAVNTLTPNADGTTTVTHGSGGAVDTQLYAPDHHLLSDTQTDTSGRVVSAAAYQYAVSGTTQTETGSESFTFNPPTADASATSAEVGTATFTLQRDVADDGTLNGATLDVNGSYADTTGGTASFTIHVTGSPTAGFTTTVTENDTTAFAALNVSINADPGWLDAFLTSVNQTLAGQAGSPVGGNGFSTATNSLAPGVNGNIAVTHTADGTTETQIYDATGRLLSDVQVNNTGQIVSAVAYSYDATGNKLTETDGSGTSARTTAWTYDSAGHKTSETVGYGTVQTATTTYTWSGNNLASVTDPNGNTTTFQYDSAGHVIAMTDPLGNTEYRSYDAQARLASITKRDGQERVLSYNDQGALAGEVWYNADGSVQDTLTYTYNDQGQLIGAGSDAGTYTLTYNARGQLARVDEPFGVWLQFGYDAEGRRILVTDSFGSTTASTYDANGHLLTRSYGQADGVVAEIQQFFNDQGQLAQQTRTSDGGAVVETDYTYDFAGRVNAILDKSDGATIADFAYAFNAAGDLTSETDNSQPTTYAYDQQGQLTTDGSGATHAFDGNGNRTDTGYVTGPDNQLLSDGTWTYTYDHDGNESTKTNIATGEKWSYGYDARDHLIHAAEVAADGTPEVEVDYQYDAFGNRAQMNAWTAALGLQVTKFAYDGWNPSKGTPIGNENWDVWADLNADGSLQTRYLRGDQVDQLFGRIEAGGDVAWTLADRLGSVRDVVGGGGQVLDALNYDGYGNITSETNTSERGRYAWTGREYDTEANLQYNHARYYDAAAGRWISQDPMGFDAGDSNLYRYASNQPLHETDPSGLERRIILFQTIEEMRKNGVPESTIDNLNKGGAKYISNPSGLVKQAGLPGSFEDYTIEPTDLHNNSGKVVKSPAGTPLAYIPRVPARRFGLIIGAGHVSASPYGARSIPSNSSRSSAAVPSAS